MTKYVVLLRGINVGIQNRVSMAELKICLEELGFDNIRSYINSGNILLESSQSPKQITDLIEAILPVKFKLTAAGVKVLVLSHENLQAVVDQAPKGFGTQPDKYHSDVVFLIDMAVEKALSVFAPKEGVDRIWPSDAVIYSQRLSTMRTKSRLSKIVGTTPYKSMTIRTWGTTTKLLKLLG